MKFICLGYIDPKVLSEMSENERSEMLDACFAYDDELREKRHFADGQALQTPDTARTLRWKDKKVSVTDGPYAETKEQLGGILVLEARDIAHAVEIMSKHPGVRYGPFEIRPAADLSGLMVESSARRGKKDQQRE